MADPTPRFIVSSKCIAYSEALLQYRRSVLTDVRAVEEGQELFAWFVNAGALTDERAGIAVRSVELGITLLKTSIETYDSIGERVRSTYTVYTQNA